MSRQTPPQFAFSAGEVSPLLYARPDYQRTQQGVRAANGFLPLRQGGLTRAPGTIYKGEAASTAACRLIAFEFSAMDAVVLEFTPLKMRVWRYGTLVDAPGNPGVPFELVTPYDAADLPNLKWVQSADVIYFVDGARAIQALKRLALDNWTISDFVPTSGPFLAENTDGTNTITASTIIGSGGAPETHLTAINPTFDPSMIGGLIRLRVASQTDVPAWTANEVLSQYSQRSYDGRVYTLTSTPADVGTVPPTHTGDLQEQVTSPGVVWRMLSDGIGVGQVVNYISATEVQVVIRRSFHPAMFTSGTSQFSLGAWSDYAGWPKAIAIFDQRLVAASTNLAPRMISFSQLGIFDDWTPGILDTDGFSYTISGSLSLNEIEWLAVGQHGLYVGTAGEVLAAQSVDQSLAITPSNFSVRPLNSLGVSGEPPIVPAGFPIILTKDRRRVFELRYSNTEQGTRPRELSLPADHIASTGLRNMVWQSTAHPLVWFTRDDGTLAAMLYDPDQDVLGWVPLSLAVGAVESLAVTTDATTGKDILTLAVRRVVNGQWRVMIEEMAEPYGTLDQSAPIEKANHLFAALDFGPFANSDSFSVPHLEGEDAFAWTENGAYGPFTVPASGTITLPEVVQYAIVGLHDPNHRADLMALHPAGNSGDTMADQRRILPDSAVVLHKTAGGTVEALERNQGEAGWFSGDAEDLVQQEILATAPAPISGPVRVQSSSGMADEVSMRFRPTPGAPMTILAVVPAIQQEAG